MEDLNGLMNEISKWKEKVCQDYSDKCKCGSITDIDVYMIYPAYLGGKMTRNNGVVLCRQCFIDKERSVSEHMVERWGDENARISLLIPKALHARIVDLIEDNKTFQGLVRDLLSEFAGAAGSRLGANYIMENDNNGK